MPELEVRPATIRDAGGAEPLVADALGQLRALRGGGALLQSVGVPNDVTPDALATALCAGALLGSATLVAVLDDAVAGFAVVTRTPESYDLLGVHTAKALRRRRIGTSLLDAARELATQHDVGFEALALPGDQSVKSLLEASGFKARLLRMSADR